MDSSLSISQPITIGRQTIPNRIVMPPLVIWQSDRTGLVTDAHLDHYRRSAGPGLVIVEATAVSPEGRLARTQLGVWSDEQTGGLSRLAGEIRSGGAVAGIQIHHAGGATDLDRTWGEPPLVPSVLPSSQDGAAELRPADIERIIEAFRSAVRRAVDAGFGYVELHGAHGYLISQFLSPATNSRTDRWGGSAEHRRRFLVECVRAAREEMDRTGSGALLAVRLGAAASGAKLLSVDEGLAAARAAVDAGCDLIDVSNAGPIDDELGAGIRARLGAVTDDAAGAWSPTFLLGTLVKRAVTVPVIAVNGIKRPAEAESALRDGLADLVAVGRGLLADPGWARKALSGRADAIEPCVDCKPRCHWFAEPARCPARARLARRPEEKTRVLTRAPGRID